jgi:hypothetical protein
LEEWTAATRHAVETFHEKIEAKLFSVDGQAARKFSPRSEHRRANQEFSSGAISSSKFLNFFYFLAFELLSSSHLSHVLCSLALVDPPTSRS